MLEGDTLWMSDYGNTGQTYRVNADIVINAGDDADGELNIDAGTYVLQDVTVKNGFLEFTMEDALFDASISIDNLVFDQIDGGSADAEIGQRVTLTVNTLKGGAGGDIVVNGTLAVEGDGNASTVDLALASTSLTVSSTGTLNLNNAADTVGLTFSDNAFATGAGYIKITSNGGTVEVDLSSIVSGDLSTELANSLFSTLASGTGLIKINGNEVDIDTTTSEDYGQVIDAAQAEGTTFVTDETLETTVVNVKEDSQITGGWQALVLDEDVSSAKVAAGGSLLPTEILLRRPTARQAACLWATALPST